MAMMEPRVIGHGRSAWPRADHTHTGGTPAGSAPPPVPTCDDAAFR